MVAVYTRRDTRPGHKARVLAPKLDNTRTLVMVKTLRSPGGARRRQRDQAHTGGDNVTIVQNKIGLCAENNKLAFFLAKLEALQIFRFSSYFLLQLLILGPQ